MENPSNAEMIRFLAEQHAYYTALRIVEECTDKAEAVGRIKKMIDDEN